MAKSYSVANARAHLPEILDEVESGRDVHLTRRGRPVAVLLSTQHYESLQKGAASFAEAYSNFREKHSLEECDFDSEFFDSLRDQGKGRPVRL